ncbi:Two-component sensor histidine kinase [Hyella patelloides LEGE 07179]|uniref:histidine kinase n=1 Tax=Hyella patelloides LEGE 07179 TaxID=945734 RepID=A0A563VL48_9CYAN|nr:ATP-binding protein [Hyella patelloides]VEP12142.1 Two-component sensor histidine kinase [Hyella patelloides LEGE 07179]
MEGVHKFPNQQLFFQAVFERSNEAIIVIDKDSHIVEINPAACALFGETRNQLIGNLISDWFDFPLDEKIAEVQWQQTDGSSKTIEYNRVRDLLPNYHLLVLRDISNLERATAEKLEREHQRVKLFAEVTLKIRQSLQLEEILRTAVTEVQSILQADRVLIYQVFADGTGMPIKEAVLPDYDPILGVEFPEEVFPEDYRELYTKGRVIAIANVRDPHAGLAECLIEFMDEWRVKAKLVVPILQNLKSTTEIDGDRLWGLLIAHQCQAPRQWTEFELELMQQLADQIGIALSQAELLENLEGLVTERTAKLRQEISDRTKAEFALRRSEEQMRLIANGLPVLIAYVDKQQHYRFNNEAYQTWLGLPPSEIYDCHLLEVHGEEEYQQIRQYIEIALSGKTISYERDLILLDGCIHSLSITYIPHLDDTDSQIVLGFFALTSDISDRKAIERMKDEFISVVSHELRTPLTSIHSSLKILATRKLGSLSSKGQRMLQIADEQTERLVRLVNNVLDLQRIQSGKVKMNKKACNATDLMIEAVQTMQAMAQEQKIKLLVEPVSWTVWADHDYIVQTLTNLISNAIKFSPCNTTVWLSATREQQNPPQQPTITQITFAVKDRGQGIPSDRIETIFERFQQVDSSDSRKKGGTGLGLAICRQIVEGHGGQIWAESCFKEGSTFYFTLPELINSE